MQRLCSCRAVRSDDRRLQLLPQSRCQQALLVGWVSQVACMQVEKWPSLFLRPGLLVLTGQSLLLLLLLQQDPVRTGCCVQLHLAAMSSSMQHHDR